MQHGRKRLRTWITRSKINQRKAAAILQISEVYLSQILHGIRVPALDTAVRFEAETGIPVASWARIKVSPPQDENRELAGSRKLATR